jgi:hypothetical protein
MNRPITCSPLLSTATPMSQPPTSSIGPAAAATPAEPPKKPKCPTCNKKLALTDLACRCGQRHCSLHRFPDTHGCTYDYRAAAQKVLSAQLERVVGEKVEKI